MFRIPPEKSKDLATTVFSPIIVCRITDKCLIYVCFFSAMLKCSDLGMARVCARPHFHPQTGVLRRLNCFVQSL